MTLRRLLFWLHLIAGSIAGIVILFLSVTGILIAYERPVLDWIDHRSFHVSGSVRQPVDEAIAHAEQIVHQRATAVAVHSDPSVPVEVTFGREPARVFMVDPYSGAVMGESAPRLRAFFATVTALHRWFGLQGVHRATAKAIKGAFTLAFAFLIVSGTVLWLPRKWTSARVRQGLFFRGNLRGRARNWNWHNVIGIWTALPLLIIVLTGVVMAYPWANDLLYRITGSPVPPRQVDGQSGQRSENRQGREHRNHPAATAMNFDLALTAAEQQVPGWRTATIRFQDQSGPLTVSVDRGDGGRPDLRTQVVFDRSSGQLLRVESFSSYNRGRQLRLWSRFLHTGEAGGLIGDTIAVLACGGAIILVITGFALALHRLGRKLQSHEAKAASTKNALQEEIPVEASL